MPVRHVLVGDTRGHVEHDDTALALDVVSVSETTKLLLAGCVPDVEADGTEVGVEGEGVDLDTEGGLTSDPRAALMVATAGHTNVLLLEFTCESASFHGKYYAVAYQSSDA